MGHQKGVFCVEGDWDSHMSLRSSIRPILELLDQTDTRKIPHIYRDAGTREELDYYLGKWVQRQYKRYAILYLAFHGHPGEIEVGDQRKSPRRIDLRSLAQKLERKCQGRLIFISSCYVMDTAPKNLEAFLQQTAAVAVCGYTGDTDWIHSAAFELLALQLMQQVPFTVKGAHAMRDHIQAHFSQLAGSLGFSMYINEPLS